MSNGLANRRRPSEPKKAAKAPAPAKRKPAVKVVVPVSDKVLLTVEEFAAVIGVGRKTAWDLAYAGKVRTVRIGRLRRVPRPALNEYVNSLPTD